MGKFWGIVSQVIKAADVVLLLIDARMIEETRHKDIEMHVKAEKKPLIYTVTKCDLVHPDQLEKLKHTLHPCVFVSSTNYHGLNQLKQKIFGEASRAGLKKTTIFVGVLGYPNVGKSSLINAMTGKGSAKTSNLAGYTRGKKKIASMRGNITFVDTPGIIPIKEKTQPGAKLKHAIIGAIDYRTEKDPDVVIMAIMDAYPGRIENHYHVPQQEDKEQTLASIALKQGLILKGKLPDIERTSVMILKQWQAGKIR